MTAKFVFAVSEVVGEPARSSKMMDAMSVVTQLRDLASEPQNREAIAKDEGCLPGLVLFLDHKDPQIVFATLQIYKVSIYYQDCALALIALLCSNHILLNFDETLMENCGLSTDITDLAKEVYEILSAPARTETLRTPVQPTRRNKPQFFINSSNKKAKTVTLHIQGLDGTDQRGVCEEALLKVKGVISFTFQMAMKRCTVRVRADLSTESLASAIAATKVLSAQQVVKNEHGEEIFVPLSTADTHIEENHHLPDYLPEDESPEKQTDRAVSRTAAKQDASGSWLSSAASFLTKTFYW
ncbi:hypothetical protein AMELA_G00193890 [Ameiurus melas]|uniref:Armadillo repeat-containing protein 1 n=1 Tax=Ameiurus melas TaxID=219545 RepID=A0A7J6A520_AMEME|nr:hypothetical protein AMELA_G00193890 [Ameiurus melas]